MTKLLHGCPYPNHTRKVNDMSKERKMVRVKLFEDGTYTIEDIEPIYATQRLTGFQNGQSVETYYCPKNKWKYYLLKLCDTKRIDNEIKELLKRKEQLESLKFKLKAGE